MSSWGTMINMLGFLKMTTPADHLFAATRL